MISAMSAYVSIVPVTHTCFPSRVSGGLANRERASLHMKAVKTWFGYGELKLRNVGEVSGEEISELGPESSPVTAVRCREHAVGFQTSKRPRQSAWRGYLR
jgi:hypothetical protein